MIGPRTLASASATPSTSSVGIRLVKKLPGPMMTASNSAIAVAHGRMDLRGRIEPHTGHAMTAIVALVHFHFTARDRAVGVFAHRAWPARR